MTIKMVRITRHIDHLSQLVRIQIHPWSRLDTTLDEQRFNADIPTREDAQRRISWLLVRALVGLRAAELTPWPIAILLGLRESYRYPWLAVVSYGLQSCWSIAFMIMAWRQQTLAPRLTGLDVSVAATCLVMAGWACLPTDAVGWSNSAVAPAMGTATVIAVAWQLRWAVVAGVALAGAYLIGVWPALDAPSASAPAAGNVISLTAFAAIGGMVARFLAGEAQTADTARAVAIEYHEQAAMERTLSDERARAYRLLHNRVLPTINALATAEPDQLEALKGRASADSVYVRGLFSGDPDDTPTDLAMALASIGHDQMALGVHVSQRNHRLPDDTPPHVVAAFADAAREALNNVAEHARVHDARVTAVAAPDGPVTVTVTDQGVGFDSTSIRDDRGITRAIRDRMREVGGAAEIESQPGEGTSVELRWPA